MAEKRKVGIVGFGRLGQYLYQKLTTSAEYEVAFVWNRTASSVVSCVPASLILEDLGDFVSRGAELIVEVAHPDITRNYGAAFIQHSDYLIGSPTALADQNVENMLRSATSRFGTYISAGAFWGGEDIRRMADAGNLHKLKVTMSKHPKSLKVIGKLKVKKDATTTEMTVLYDGPVRQLCSLAPHNVNTMAAAAIAAHNLGFDGVEGCLVADVRLLESHIVEVEVWGQQIDSSGRRLHVRTVRENPAPVGEVTGSATFNSLWASLQSARGKGPGIHLC